MFLSPAHGQLLVPLRRPAPRQAWSLDVQQDVDVTLRPPAAAAAFEPPPEKTSSPQPSEATTIVSGLPDSASTPTPPPLEQPTPPPPPPVPEEPKPPPPPYADGPPYWDYRYLKDEAPFEWVVTHAQMREAFEEITQGHRDLQILHVGCGNSTLGEDLYDDGYRNVVNIDNSTVAIDLMKKRNVHRPELQWLVEDATAMPQHGSESFDVVVDKSLLDTFTCCVNARELISIYIAEMDRLLKPGGTFLIVSYEIPDKRLRYFTHLSGYDVREVEFPPRTPTSQANYAYILKKSAVLE
eukprot:TRINITY_DN103802_c0_g1_i1.p1 TRINITY_DN103802_c0_g1~~TRINITY_DN103802_c0_g1_i1.p1  ORF type:complete len:316 (-),score=59.52 TRINITY_DN103802_c0_g1_i1:376-1263(-)